MSCIYLWTVLSVLICISLCTINFFVSCFVNLPISVSTVSLLLLLLLVEYYIWEDPFKFRPQDIKHPLVFVVSGNI